MNSVKEKRVLEFNNKRSCGQRDQDRFRCVDAFLFEAYKGGFEMTG